MKLFGRKTRQEPILNKFANVELNKFANVELFVKDQTGQPIFLLHNRRTGETYPFPNIDLFLYPESEFSQIIAGLRKTKVDSNLYPIVEHLCPGIDAVLYLDDKNIFETVSEKILADQKLPYATARNGALARLRELASELIIETTSTHLHVTFPSSVNKVASFMLITDAWLRPQDTLGAPVFAAGTRNQLYLCGADDADAVAQLRNIARQAYDNGLSDPERFGFPLTPQLLTIKDGKLALFDR